MRGTLVRVCAVLLALAGAGGAPAAAQVTTGGITGRVTDSAGAVVPEATVEVVDPATGLRRNVAVRSNGMFLVQGLEPGGPYRVTVRAIGFQPAVRTNVNVKLSQNVRADAVMARQTVQVEEIVVAGVDADPDFTASRQGVQTTINDTLLRRLPTLDRDFSDFVKLTPQVSVREGEGGGVTAAGQNNRYNAIQIDGATVNDRFGLGRTGSAGGQADGRPVGLDAVKEYQVLLSPYDVRQGNFTGALINAVTKNGTNTFSGSAYVSRRQDNWAGFPVDQNEFSNWQFGGSIGGPIKKDKIHFFANAEFRREDQPASGPYFGFNEGPVVVRSADVDAFNARASALGLAGGNFNLVQVERPLANVLGRVDFQLNDANRLTVKYQYNDASRDVFSRTTSITNPTMDLDTYGYYFQSKTHNPAAQWLTNFKNGSANEFRLSLNRIRDARTPNVFEPIILVQNYPQASGTPLQVYSLRSGSEEFSQGNELDQDIWELTDNFTFPVGNHRVTVGTRNELYKVRNLFAQASYGVWQFDNQANFDAGIVEQYRARLPLPGSNNGEAKFTSGQLGFYVQDDWTVTPTFQLTGGLRADVPFFSTDLAYDQRVIADFGAQDTPGGQVLFSPRVGFNWDFNGKGISQLRGGLGLFTGVPAYVWYSNAYGNNGLGLVGLTCGQGGPAGSLAPAFSPDAGNPPNTCATGETVAPGGALGEVDLIGQDTKFPQVFRANLSFDRRLPYGIIGSIEGLYSKDVNQFFIVNRNLNAPTGTDANGRVLYGTLNANGTVTPSYFDLATYGPSFNGGVYELRNTSKGYSISLTGQLRRNFGRNLQASVGYTYSEAYDVQSFTSSRAISNWQFGRVHATNDLNDERTRSSFDRPHRIVASGTYTIGWKFPTDISLTYVGQSGTPYTYRTGGASGRGDLNRDGSNSNDAIYIPTGIGDPNGPVFSNAAQEAAFQEFIDGDNCLSSQRGSIMERNSCRNPWQNRVDMSFRQNLPVMQGTASFEIQIFNVLRMLDRDWGNVKTVGGGQFFDQAILDVTSATGINGREIVTFNPALLDNRYQLVSSAASVNPSTYYIQAGLRVTF